LKYNQTIGLICNVWDDPRGVMRILSQDSILDFDFLCFFDGKFSNWEGKPEFNDDEVHKVVADFGEKYQDMVSTIYENVQGKTEAEKRNHSFYISKQLGFDWGLVVDADEIPYLDKHKWNEEKDLLKDSSFGCHAVNFNNHGQLQRRPRLYNMRESPYLIQHPDKTSHNHIYSSIDGRDLPVDVTKTTYTVESIKLEHNKEFYSKYRFECRNKFATISNH